MLEIFLLCSWQDAFLSAWQKGWVTPKLQSLQNCLLIRQSAEEMAPRPMRLRKQRCSSTASQLEPAGRTCKPQCHNCCQRIPYLFEIQPMFCLLIGPLLCQIQESGPAFRDTDKKGGIGAIFFQVREQCFSSDLTHPVYAFQASCKGRRGWQTNAPAKPHQIAL